MKILIGYNEKYTIPFTNVQGHACYVRFLVQGWEGGSTELTGGSKPFLLGEFNNDEDYFKPIRPQQATIEIFAKAGLVSIDDFLADNDNDIIVQFDLGDWTGYWYGYLSQEDMQETWVDTGHILTLRATEGLGELKDVSFPDDNGVYTPLTFIETCLGETINNTNDATIISNLFHSSMTDAVDDTGLEQCLIDSRTFETQPTVFEDCYTVLEKINKAWGQTIFQYDGKWFIYRLSEIFKTPTLDLNGFYFDGSILSPSKISFTTRYDISVGVNEIVKPISPEMLRFLRKPAKDTKIVYNWENFEEIVCNESFQRGTFIAETATEITYTVDCWTLESSPISAPVVSGDELKRKLEYNADGKVEDEYVFIKELTFAQSWMRSSRVYVSEGEQIKVNVNVKWSVTHTKANCRVMYLLFAGESGTYYSYNPSGDDWVVATGYYTTTPGNIFIDYATAISTDWNELDFITPGFPEDGYLEVLLVKEYDFGVIPSGGSIYFKDLRLEIRNGVTQRTNRDIKGDYDKYTIEKGVNKYFEDEIFLDDADSKQHKGAIFEADGITLTGDQWYRRDYPGEAFTFKRINALGHWFMNRSYKSKIDANFLGITYENDGVEYPIGLMNTVQFVQDAPTKTFAIVNLKEIDFMSCQWSATLIEVYDTDVIDDVPGETDVHTFNYIYGNKS